MRIFVVEFVANIFFPAVLLCVVVALVLGYRFSNIVKPYEIAWSFGGALIIIGGIGLFVVVKRQAARSDGLIAVKTRVPNKWRWMHLAAYWLIAIGTGIQLVIWIVSGM